jgi:excisionase family DNA binding protein
VSELDGLLAAIERMVGGMVETKVGELLDGPTQASSPWLTIAEAADYLHTSERTIERMVARDRVRSTTVGRPVDLISA